MRWLRERWAAWNAPGYPVRESVIVNTLSDQTFRGVLWEKRGDYLVLRNAELLKNRAETVPLPGEIVIERWNVDFLQVLRA